jgi:hypothetical protein
MQWAAHESGLADRVLQNGNKVALQSVPGVEARVHQELSDLFASAVAFADFCRFLTSGGVSDQAEQLASLAEALHEDTAAELRRSRPRG